MKVLTDRCRVLAAIMALLHIGAGVSFAADDPATADAPSNRHENVEISQRTYSTVRPTDALAAKLAAERATVATVGMQNGKAVILINGEPHNPFLYGMTAGFDTARGWDQHLIRGMRDSGIHLYTFYYYLREAWGPSNTFHSTALLGKIANLIAVDPKAYLIIRCHLEPPNWWFRKYPGEMTGYAMGPVEPNTANNGNDIERVERPSFASEQWMGDVVVVLRQLIQAVENSPYGKRVIGYQPAYGIFGETHYWGMAYMPDTGAPMQARFKQWVRETYRTEDALRRSWGANATFDSVAVPTAEERLRTGLGIFRTQADQKTIDYYHCQHQVHYETVTRLCRTVKEETRGAKLAGGFFAYYFYIDDELDGGHLNGPRIIESPYVDFLSGPISYDLAAQGAGGDGLLRSVVGSIVQHGKLYISEFDSPTHIGQPAGAARFNINDLATSIANMRLCFFADLTENCGQWYFDFGPPGAPSGGNWNHRAFYAEIKSSMAIARKAWSLKTPRVSETAVVVDPESYFHLANIQSGRNFVARAVTGGDAPFLHTLYRSGAPFDILYVDDVLKARAYKLYLFPDSVYLSSRQRDALRRMIARNKARAVWFYAPGFVNETGPNVSNVSAVTGMNTEMTTEAAPLSVVVPRSRVRHPIVSSLRFRAIMRPGARVPTESAFDGFTAPGAWSYDHGGSAKYESCQMTSEQDTGQGRVLVWRFRPNYLYADALFRCRIGDRPGAAVDAIALRVRTSAPITIYLKLVDADGAEWVTTPVTVQERDGWKRLTFPVSLYTVAGWSRDADGRFDFPIRGIAPVVQGISRGQQYVVRFSRMTALESDANTAGQQPVYQFALSGTGSPTFYINDPKAVPLGTYLGTDKTALAVKGNSVFVGIPFVTRELMAGIYRWAGVHVYLASDDVIRMNKRFMMVATHDGGRRTVRFPEPRSVFDLVRRKQLSRSSRQVELNLSPGETGLYELNDR